MHVGGGGGGAGGVDRRTVGMELDQERLDALLIQDEFERMCISIGVTGGPAVADVEGAVGLGIRGDVDEEPEEDVAAARETPLSYAQALAGSGGRRPAAANLAPEATRPAPAAATTATATTTTSSSPPLELEADGLAALWEEEAPQSTPRHFSAASMYGREGRPPAWLLPRPATVDGHSSTSGLSAGARPFYPSSSGNSPYLHSSEPPVRACVYMQCMFCDELPNRTEIRNNHRIHAFPLHHVHSPAPWRSCWRWSSPRGAATSTSPPSTPRRRPTTTSTTTSTTSTSTTTTTPRLPSTTATAVMVSAEARAAVAAAARTYKCSGRPKRR